MKMEVATMRVGREITEFENELEALVARAGTLIAEIANASRVSGIPAAQSQRAFTRIAAAQSKLVEVRGDVVRAHEDLRRIAETNDYPTECPPSAAAGSGARVKIAA